MIHQQHYRLFSAAKTSTRIKSCDVEANEPDKQWCETLSWNWVFKYYLNTMQYLQVIKKYFCTAAIPHKRNNKLSYRRGTARCVVSVEILPIATQQCRNYLYDKSLTDRSYEVGGYSGPMCNKHVHSTMTRSSRFRCPIGLGIINKPTTVELWISPVYRRLAVAKFSKSTI